MPNAAKERKKVKLEMLRHCRTWQFSLPMTKAYFKQRGYKLSDTHYYELKAELDSENDRIEWFNEMAIENMEKDHQLDYETISALQNTLVQEIQQLSSTPIYIQTNDAEGKPKYIFNKNHNSMLIARLIAQVESLTKTKSSMLAANPMVQAIMVDRRQKEEEMKELENKIVGYGQ